MMKTIRNFSIIAHIDHGKSTLADRLIQFTGVVALEISRIRFWITWTSNAERITIKSQAIALPYHAQDGPEYILN